MSILNPLTEAHCRDLDAVIQQYPHLRDTLDALERCGLQCSEQKQMLEAQYQICSAIKREFNPLST